MLRPARSRYGATRPAVLDWFKRYNEGRPYPEQVKPFNFLLTFFSRRREDLAVDDPTHDFDPRLDEIRPVAPFEKDSEKALKRIFDRNSETLAAVSRTWLRTVADVLRDYHRQPEYKFLGGGWNEDGVLRRRHVFVDTIEDIGKESDAREEDEARSEDQSTVLIYPSPSFDRERVIERIKSVGQQKLKRELMCEAGIAMRTITAACADQDVADEDLKRMVGAADRIANQKKEREEKEAAAEIGIVALARMLDVDAALDPPGA